ncbi:MAG: type 4a pilus biogenesis protein PilO [Candidatus Omnitrophica bacterium]|nr:type 4a pilus biogenesis protein PilO [Candidatus Omnitrophota bacterium]
MRPPSNKSPIAAWIEAVPAAQRLWLIRTLLLLIALLIGGVGIQAPWSEKQRLLQQVHREELERTGTLSAINSQEKDLKRWTQALLFQGETAALTDEVTRLAGENRLRIELVLPQPQVSLGPYTRIQVRVAVTSTFPDLLSFIQRLERHQPLLHLDQLEIERSDPTKATLLISAFSKPAGKS